MSNSVFTPPRSHLSRRCHSSSRKDLFPRILAKSVVFCYYIQVMLTKKKKEKTIKETQVHDKDTGSPEVQVSILTKRITELTKHLKKNNKDKHPRRGLLGMVAARRTHLKYLEKKDKKRYSAVIKKLGLKK